MRGHKQKYPLREYLGAFEKWILVMKGGVCMRLYDKTLSRFFDMFSGKTSVEQFTSVDIADYKVIRLKQGTNIRSLTYELCMIRKFWKWLIEDKGLPLNDIAAVAIVPYKLGNTVRRGNLSLDDVTRLLNECPSVGAKRVILEAMGGPTRSRKFGREIREAAVRAGLLGFSLYHLQNRTMSRLSQDIVKRYCQQILDSLLQESKLDGNSTGAVQVAPVNVGATICNNSDYPLVGNRIDQQESSPKG